MLTRHPVRVVASATRNVLDGHGRRHASGSSPSERAHGSAGVLGAGEEDELLQLPATTTTTARPAALETPPFTPLLRG
jgi:hypothetical protein